MIKPSRTPTRIQWQPVLAVCCVLFVGQVGQPDESATVAEPAIADADLEHWAFVPVQPVAVPIVEDSSWCRNAIDRFVLRELEADDLQPAGSSSREALLRRVCFDLTGLPPTPQQRAQFVADERQGAYERLVDRLLADPGYGERWSQHWLDLVRFSETDGFEHDHVRPEAWQYRDWLIDALNADLSFDVFVQQQLAGDILFPDDPQAAIATGFLLAGPDMPDINLKEERRHNFLNGMAANVGEVLLGLQFGCAQCHDHKTDPISQADFYRLRAFFESVDLFEDHPLPARTDTEPVKVRIAREADGETPESRLWIRGDFRRPGPRLIPGFPRIFNQDQRSVDEFSPTGNGRDALARWITHPNNPATARVICNRIWQYHFGVGLAGTPSDFGWMGDGPTHPELLDWLAGELVRSGWSLKHMHRLILTSATYRTASRLANDATPTQRESWQRLVDADPDNRLLGRFRRTRLFGEALRDAVLAVSGELNRTQYGPGVRPDLPPPVAATLLKNQWPVTEDEAEHRRRSVYLFRRRNLRLPLLEAFDQPNSNLSCARRVRTTIAPQALHLLNSDFAVEQSAALAKRVQEEASTPSARIRHAYLLALARPPSDPETEAALQFFREADESKWRDFCHALLNLNEFVYLD